MEERKSEDLNPLPQTIAVGPLGQRPREERVTSEAAVTEAERCCWAAETEAERGKSGAAVTEAERYCWAAETEAEGGERNIRSR